PPVTSERTSPLTRGRCAGRGVSPVSVTHLLAFAVGPPLVDTRPAEAHAGRRGGSSLRERSGSMSRADHLPGGAAHAAGVSCRPPARGVGLVPPPVPAGGGPCHRGPGPARSRRVLHAACVRGGTWHRPGAAHPGDARPARCGLQRAGAAADV